jgi:hypothetical protein
MNQAKVELIKNLSLPTSVKQIRSFLGHAGFYRPLCSLLAKDTPLHFDKACQEAFLKLWSLLSFIPIMKPLDWSLPFEIVYDSFNYIVGLVLGQHEGKLPHVIYYASKTLIDAQVNYTMTEKGLLAVIFALDKSRSYLLGSKVIIYFNHVA